MDTKQTIIGFLTKNFIKGNDNKIISDNSSFLEEGIIDSVGVLELVAFIEETYGFRVEDEELVPENLDSVNKLVNFVNTKLAATRS